MWYWYPMDPMYSGKIGSLIFIMCNSVWIHRPDYAWTMIYICKIRNQLGISLQWSCSIPVAEIEFENFGIHVYLWGNRICGPENSKFEKNLCQNDWWGLPDECERKIKKIGPLEQEISRGNQGFTRQFRFSRRFDHYFTNKSKKWAHSVYAAFCSKSRWLVLNG